MSASATVADGLMMPDLSAGLCRPGRFTTLTPEAWTDPHADPDLRDRAVAVCQCCPVLEPCRTWALSQPLAYFGDVIVAGLTSDGRRSARERGKRRAAAIARIGRTPVRARAVAELLADAKRSNRVIARAAFGYETRVVSLVRRELEAARLIEAYRAPSHAGLAWTPLQEKVRSELLADPARANRVIGGALGTTESTVAKVRRRLERTLTLARYRAPSHPPRTLPWTYGQLDADAAAAGDDQEPGDTEHRAAGRS